MYSLLLLFLLGWSTPSPDPELQELEDLSQFKSVFNSDTRSHRMLLLLSPT